jgi:hypothetical protein
MVTYPGIGASAGAPEPISYLFEERWDGADGANWSTTRWPTGARRSDAQGDSAVDIQSGEGRIAVGSSPLSGTYRYTTLDSNSGNLGNVDIRFTHRFTSTSEAYSYCYFRHTNGWRAADPEWDITDGYQVSLSASANTLALSKYALLTKTSLITPVTKTWGTTAWNLRIQAIGSAIKVKAWQGSEPGTWDIEVTDGVHSTGIISLGRVSGSSSTIRTAFFDDLTVVAAS